MSEFSRPERLDAIGEGERVVTITAQDAERAALATRFGLVAIEALGATLTVHRDAAGIRVRGRVRGAVVQACSITDDPLRVAIDEPVALMFVEPGGSIAEIELAENALDTVEIEGAAIDLGEVAAETMALALDPFPRGPNAAAALKAAGVITEEEAKPAGPFAGLKDQLAGR
ncbi:YceD family protein [Sphingomonas oligophenolica]|uniref:DUF177 domain-containing protein n=1 Tax=Sphingomonas oligophenolica TaxID=301154 RepID=A0A502CRW7_9SPHN|nr:DUF177 domain-containing protein [Sphingomonas oligophenolica]TPG15628.1 DUF177 domain-containing protein [Sphingomonas oligophenolica]